MRSVVPVTDSPAKTQSSTASAKSLVVLGGAVVAGLTAYLCSGDLLTAGVVFLVQCGALLALSPMGSKGTGDESGPAASPTPARGRVIWFTGLPSSGKTTLSLLLKDALMSAGYDVEHLDGDAVRNVLPGIGFSREARNDHIRRMGFLASRLEAHGVTVIASFVSPYCESRDFARSLCADFNEIYLATNLDECSRRDVKGLYREAQDGRRAGMTGVDDPYEPPVRPELVLDTKTKSKEECVQAVLQLIERGTSGQGRSQGLSNGSSSERDYGSFVAA